MCIDSAVEANESRLFNMIIEDPEREYEIAQEDIHEKSLVLMNKTEMFVNCFNVFHKENPIEDNLESAFEKLKESLSYRQKFECDALQLFTALMDDDDDYEIETHRLCQVLSSQAYMMKAIGWVDVKCDSYNPKYVDKYEFLLFLCLLYRANLSEQSESCLFDIAEELVK